MAGILGAILPEAMDMNEKLPKYVLLLGVVLILCALGLLIIYGYNAIGIRKMQHEFNPHIDKRG